MEGNKQEVILKLDNVSHFYKIDDSHINTAIKNISLEVKRGEYIAIIGHNGSGKSTLAKLFNGLIIPKKGIVEVFGMNTKDKKYTFDIRKHVGIIFQNPDNQMVASIVEDDIAFGPENLGVPREEIIKRVDWALKAVGMEEYRKKTPFKMSGGQKQRIAIAGMLAMKPDILVLDESTAMLDPFGRDEVLKVVKKLNKEENMTIILITHYMDETLNADRLIVLNNGEIIDDDTPTKVFRNYDKLKELKLRFPVIADIAHRLRKEGLPLKDDILEEKDLIEELCQLL